jgi:hypothetical protein
MNRTLPVLALSAALAVAACKKVEEPAPAPSTKASPPAAADASNTAAAASDGSQSSSSAPTTPEPTPQAPQLAMAYRLGLVLPADQVRPLMESHQEVCERAGPDQCQVLGADAKADGKDRVSAELTLRATPAWMRVFRTRAEADAKDLGGRIQDASTEGEDLSGSIVDTDAAQRARAAERARLTELMQRQTKSLDETLAVEQEITRVQTEMDQASSELAAMQGRIAMQTVSVAYTSAALAAPDGVTAPLAEASRGFMGNVVAVLAALVTLASFLLPVGLVAAPLVWWIGRLRKPRPALRNGQPIPPPA